MGLDPDTFWDMTPYEFGKAIRGWERRMELRRHELAWQTCHIVNCCGHLKRPIRLEELLGEEKGQARAATDEDRKHFEKMREKFGG